MPAQSMEEIIAKLEKAGGPDRELDAEIFATANRAVIWSYHDNCHIDAQIERGIYKGKREEHPDFDPDGDNYLTWRFRIGESPNATYGEIPHLTASIDAALTLVPENMRVDMNREFGGHPSRSAYACVWGASGNRSVRAHALPIALCIAALKARTATETGGE